MTNSPQDQDLMEALRSPAAKAMIAEAWWAAIELGMEDDLREDDPAGRAEDQREALPSL